MRIVTDFKHAQQIIVELDAEVERLQARVAELERKKYQEQARVWMSWYVLWENILPKMAMQDIEARLKRIDGEVDYTHYSLDDGL